MRKREGTYVRRTSRPLSSDELGLHPLAWIELLFLACFLISSDVHHESWSKLQVAPYGIIKMAIGHVNWNSITGKANMELQATNRLMC